MKLRNNINEDVWFTKNDIIKVPRSTFFRNQDKKLTFDAGKLIPIFCDEIMPGDSMDIKLNSVIRFASPMIRPVMDDVKFEAWAFFVPSRLCDANFENVIANNQRDPDWSVDVTTTLTKLISPLDGKCFAVQSVADYFGLPTGDGNLLHLDGQYTFFNALPFIAYTLIWDSYFRDEALQKTITPVLKEGDTFIIQARSEMSGDYIVDAISGGTPCPLNKVHDVFTSARPAPCKGVSPSVPIGGLVQVNGTLGSVEVPGNTFRINAYSKGREFLYSQYINSDPGSATVLSRYDNYNAGTSTGRFTHSVDNSGYFHDATYGTLPLDSDIIFGNAAADIKLDNKGMDLRADLSQVSGISVNDLRSLVQLQRLKEQDARYGTRYNEYLLGSWGVVSSDARLQRPEFLGKVSFDLAVQQSVQTSQTSQESAQSNVSAYSLTGNSKRICSKSFVEHGYLIIVGGARIKNRTYSQRIDKMWRKFSRLDFYNPVFANLGEQPVMTSELEAIDHSRPDMVFGYQEAWYEYRYLPNQVCGYMKPGLKDSLAVWNYADNYNDTPTLSPEWIQEDISSIDRTLAIPSSTGAMFLADFYFINKATRPMPLHSVGGLIDHSGKIII